ncbi:hypothetical protein GmHk_06G017246 [Glycine max]|nr:hypothetical protein GmHk_06G017246 [Glycine max]
MVHVDPSTGKADNPHKKKLRTYLGIVACDKVDVTYENWKQVHAAQKDLIWEDIQDVRKKAQVVLKQNTTPHVLSRGGYEYLEQELMVEKTKKKLEEVAQSGSTEAMIDPPSPIRRHMKWKMACTKKTIQMTSESTKEIAEKIDVLTAAIGRPEHPGRVRATGAAARVSTKESCVDPSGNDPDTGDSDKCGLYIEENPPRLVPLGRVYEGSITVHNIPLLHDQVKVSVEEVKDVDAPVPVPTDEHTMRKRRKLNIIQNDGQSQAKEQSIESSTEVNQNNNSILEENAQFEGEQHIQEDSHVQSHTSLESASERSTKGKKRTRGYTHMLDVWDLPDGEFILVEVDHWGNPMGWEGKTILNAIGSLVRRHQCAPINFLSWKDMPKDYITDMVESIQSKFRFAPELTEQTKKILINDMSLKWRQFKYELKLKGYDETKTKEEMDAHIPDPRVDPSQYRDLVHYWCFEKGQKISNINKRSCSKYKDLHCMGTNNLPRRIHEMTTKAKGVQPSREKIYIDTRTRKDGSIVTEKAAIVIVPTNGSTSKDHQTTNNLN